MNEQRIVIISSILSVIMALIAVYAYFFVLPPQIPLFYSLARPQDQLADKAWFFMFPAIAMFMSLVQLPFLRLQHTEEHYTTIRVLVLFSCFSVILISIAFSRVLFLVT